MAYNFYPQPQFYQQPQMQPQQMMQQTQPQMQSGGFMSIRSEQDARNYPVAPGSVVTFKIENQPYVCEKAQGFSQLEGPIFNKYRLVKEDVSEAPDSYKRDTSNEEIVNSTMNDLKREIESIWNEIDVLKKKPTTKKKEVITDDAE